MSQFSLCPGNIHHLPTINIFEIFQPTQFAFGRCYHFFKIRHSQSVHESDARCGLFMCCPDVELLFICYPDVELLFYEHLFLNNHFRRIFLRFGILSTLVAFTPRGLLCRSTSSLPSTSYRAVPLPRDDTPNFLFFIQFPPSLRYVSNRRRRIIPFPFLSFN